MANNMKTIYTIASLFLLVFGYDVSYAWGTKGHQIVAEIARRQLEPKASARIAALLPGSIADEASWADSHRNDPEYTFTDAYHTMAMNHDLAYDPGWRMWRGGDCVTGLDWLDYSLSNQERLHLSDSVKLFQIRMLLHIIGDMHCPGHAYIMPEENHWDCSFQGETTTYHAVIDKAPKIMYGSLSATEIASTLDTFPASEIEQCCYGDTGLATC